MMCSACLNVSRSEAQEYHRTLCIKLSSLTLWPGTCSSAYSVGVSLMPIHQHFPGQREHWQRFLQYLVLEVGRSYDG